MIPENNIKQKERTKGKQFKPKFKNSFNKYLFQISQFIKIYPSGKGVRFRTLMKNIQKLQLGV